MEKYIKSTTKFLKNTNPFTWVFSLILITAIAVAFSFTYSKNNKEDLLSKINLLTDHVAILESQFASTTITLESSIKESETALSNALSQEKQNLQNQLGSFQNEVTDISGTLNTLEKLSKTDPELLQKYSKVFFLNEHYTPPRVEDVPDQYKYYEKRSYQVHAQVWPYLQRMLDAAEAAGIEIYVYSAYRSFDEQSALKGAYTVTYGAGTANQFSADQGYSEHQLGTTVDLITPGIGGTLNGFENTPAYSWLISNADAYGFALSYPKNNDFYIYEPWHWRFVGTNLASKIKNSGQSFYEMEQRDIDEYLVSIFD